METNTLAVDGAEIAYDVTGPRPTADGRPPLLMIGQPMTAEGFHALASHLTDRTVVLYDPRGLGRSGRTDGRVDHDPEVQAGDLHALVDHLGVGPVDVFASSGGAVTGLAWVATHPADVATLVAHEPPVIGVLPDADVVARAVAGYGTAYAERGWGAGMAGFVHVTSWSGAFTEEFLARPWPDPAAFGMPAVDDGSRDDPLLSGRARAVLEHRPDVAALLAAPTRVVLAVGEESGDTLCARTARATAAQLGRDPVVFPGHHGGFGAEDGPWPGRATAFAARLREVLAAPAPQPSPVPSTPRRQ